MIRRVLNDATTRHLEEIAEDLRGLLGGIELTDLAIDRFEDGVTLRAGYGMAGQVIESVGSGASVIEAHAALRLAIVEDRVGLGFRVLV